VPELFHHQHRFIGRLAIRRVRRLESSDPNAPLDVLLVTHAWHDERRARCPALADDGRCSLEADRKPLVCTLAPLDALVPDALQARVLAVRARDAAFFEADCLVTGERPGFAPLVRRLRVVDLEAQRTLARRREALALEKRFWGTHVFRLLEPGLFSQPAELAKIPPDGFMSLSIAPVLMVVAEASTRCRARCVEYLDAQLALARKLELDDVVRTHAPLRDAMLRRDAGAPARPLAADAEAWLGLTEAA